MKDKEFEKQRRKDNRRLWKRTFASELREQKKNKKFDIKEFLLDLIIFWDR